MVVKAPRLGTSSEVASEGAVCVVNGLIGIGDAAVVVSELIVSNNPKKEKEKRKKWSKKPGRLEAAEEGRGSQM